ncbi:MAG TPA: hypothetical protein VGL58_06350 [Caulobacteraceae bacterium]|jgi:hypothetical protein
MTQVSHRRRLALADPAALDREELRRLGKAERKLASPDHAIAAAGQREVQDIERRHAQRLADRSLATRLGETQSLAKARGESVRAESVRIATPLMDEHGARIVRHGLPVYRQETVSRVRILSRGGLQLAFERGDLDGGPVKAERLYELGKRYRTAFETASALTTRQRNLAPISGCSPMRSSSGPQDAVFAAGEALRRWREGLSPRQLAALDAVCGLDLSLNAAAARLVANPRTVRRLLLEGLVLAADGERQARDDRASSCEPPPGSGRL